MNSQSPPVRNYILCISAGFPEESGTTWALSDEDYKISLGVEYIYFEITAPEELAYTYKANPATFAPSWPNTSYNGLGLVPTDPPCGCGYIRNHEEVEGKIALVDRGDCSFVSKVRKTCWLAIV